MMNWIIIAPSSHDDDLKTIQNFLKDKFKLDSYEIGLYANLNREEYLDVIRHASQATHCVILNSSKMFRMGDYTFLLGLLSGKNVETFIFTGEKYEIHYETLSLNRNTPFKVFNSLDELKKSIESGFRSIHQKDVQKNALVQLFTKGLPFTSDCFATYIAKGDFETCTLFYEAGMLVNTCTSDGIPLICIATRNDHKDMVEWLLDKGADINAISADRGYSAVMDAVWRKNYDITEILVESGADLSYVSSDGQPIMVLAVGNGNAKIAKLLLANGADPDIRDSMGMSARNYATLFKRPDIVELMNRYSK